MSAILSRFSIPSPNRLTVVGLCLLLIASSWLAIRIVEAADASCQGSPISIPTVTKKLLTTKDKEVRPGNCIRPTAIIIQTTNSPGQSQQQVWEYMNGGSNGNKTSVQFLIGTDGAIWQTMELYSDKVEQANATNGDYDEQSISIALVGPATYEKKDDVPDKQYQAVLKLSLALMDQYDIPAGEHPASWIVCKSGSDTVSSGVYGHYQLCIDGKNDPGQTVMATLRQDILASAPTTGTSPDSTTLGGRWVPYDAYARPYSWPMNGTILQNYGFTPQAQNLGERYPSLYPKGDPGVVFSTTNHNVPPPSNNDKYLNPNIDIAPTSSDPSARAVYSTQAGWVTFADWAGEAKGYSIQVESDVDGDGQADLATRYMRLQAPENGEFAPDIKVYTPTESAEALPGANTTQPQTPLPAPYVMEGESMKYNGKSTVVNDSSASGGKALSLDAADTATKAYNDPADQIAIRVKKSGNALCGSVPTLVLTMDGQVITQERVESTKWVTLTHASPFDGANRNFIIRIKGDGNGSICPVIIDNTTFTVTNPDILRSKTLSERTYEAENLAHRDTPDEDNDKPEEKTEAGVSNGKYIHFSDNGSISDTISVKEGNWIKVRAKGGYCQDDWPQMVVKLDDKVVLQASVSDVDWVDYATTLNLDAGSSTDHSLNISFSNDATSGIGPFITFCSRSLDVDVITIQNNSASQTTANPSSLIGKTKYVGYNQLLGYVSVARGRTLESQKEHPGANIDNVPNANQSYLSYRIMYNNPNFTTFPSPDQPDTFINARVDNPYITETADNTVAGNLKVAWDHLSDPMWFFCALRTTGNSVLCTQNRNP